MVASHAKFWKLLSSLVDARTFLYSCLLVSTVSWFDSFPRSSWIELMLVSLYLPEMHIRDQGLSLLCRTTCIHHLRLAGTFASFGLLLLTLVVLLWRLVRCTDGRLHSLIWEMEWRSCDLVDCGLTDDGMSSLIPLSQLRVLDVSGDRYRQFAMNWCGLCEINWFVFFRCAMQRTRLDPKGRVL